jgi:hypothetical protein
VATQPRERVSLARPHIHRADRRVLLHAPSLKRSWVLFDELLLDRLEFVLVFFVVVAVLTRALLFDAKNASFKALAVQLQAFGAGAVATFVPFLVRSVLLIFRWRWSIASTHRNAAARVSRLLSCSDVNTDAKSREQQRTWRSWVAACFGS